MKPEGNFNSPIIGDLWEQPGFRVISTNLQGVHGRGLARQACDRGLIKRFDHYNFMNSPIHQGVICIAVKGNAPETARIPGCAWSEQCTGGNIDLMRFELKQLITFALVRTNTKFYMPYIGLGFGEGDITEIGPLLRAVDLLPNVYFVARSPEVRMRYPESLKPGVRRDTSSFLD